MKALRFAPLCSALAGILLLSPAAADPLESGFADPPDPAIFAATQTPPGIEFRGAPADAHVLFTHRSANEAEIHFISNQKDHPETMNCAFRVTGRQPELTPLLASAGISRNGASSPARPSCLSLSLPPSPGSSSSTMTGNPSLTGKTSHPPRRS